MAGVCSKQHTHLAQELRKVKEDFQPELEELLLGCDSMPTRGASRSVKLAGAAAVPGPGSTSESKKMAIALLPFSKLAKFFPVANLSWEPDREEHFGKYSFSLAKMTKLPHME